MTTTFEIQCFKRPTDGAPRIEGCYFNITTSEETDAEMIYRRLAAALPDYEIELRAVTVTKTFERIAGNPAWCKEQKKWPKGTHMHSEIGPMSRGHKRVMAKKARRK